MILVIGSADDAHAQYFLDVLNHKSIDCAYFDTRTFPETLSLNLSPNKTMDAGSMVLPDGRTIWLDSIEAIYWRYHHGIHVPSGISPDISGLIYREIESALGSFFRNLPHVRWVNPVSAIERHRYKPHQLYLLSQADIPIPKTLISNDPNAVQAFYDRCHGKVIYKPVAGGAHTTRLTADDLSESRMHELRQSPVQFQEMIDGVDIRVYVIGSKLYAAEIRSQTLDFRDDPSAPIVPVELPTDVQAQCFKLAELFEYKFTGIDIRRTPEGQHVFIEGNPSPMFIYFEQTTQYPITQALLDVLQGRDS